jgi:hypothetical protein
LFSRTCPGTSGEASAESSIAWSAINIDVPRVWLDTRFPYPGGVDSRQLTVDSSELTARGVDRPEDCSGGDLRTVNFRGFRLRAVDC